MRDDERCGRSKQVRTPELIGQLQNFMDKDCRVSIETIRAQFDVSVGTVHNYSGGTEDTEDWCKVYPRVPREHQIERCCHGSREMIELISSDPVFLDALVNCDES